MGNGIAHVFAQNGYNLNLIDIKPEALERALATIEKNLNRMVAKEKITVAGDTRIDRVLTIAAEAKGFSEIATFLQEKKVLVAGSTWLPDEVHLANWFKEDRQNEWKLIIAPHDIRAKRLGEVEERFKGSTIQ